MRAAQDLDTDRSPRAGVVGDDKFSVMLDHGFF
jgi:hypothetical protein